MPLSGGRTVREPHSLQRTPEEIDLREKLTAYTKALRAYSYYSGRVAVGQGSASSVRQQLLRILTQSQLPRAKRELKEAQERLRRANEQAAARGDPPLHVKGSILEHIMKPDTPGRQAVTVRRYDDI